MAALLARRLTQPLRRLGAAAGELAAGRSPEPVPREGTEELDELAVAFNGMSEQLALARDAERAVLLSVSHDLRTPLTSIRGYAEGIEDGTIEPARRPRWSAARRPGWSAWSATCWPWRGCARGCWRCAASRSTWRPSSARRRSACARGPREAGVEVRVEGGPAPATADHGRALQVVTNLLDNAIRRQPPRRRR